MHLDSTPKKSWCEDCYHKLYINKKSKYRLNKIKTEQSRRQFSVPSPGHARAWVVASISLSHWYSDTSRSLTRVEQQCGFGILVARPQHALFEVKHSHHHTLELCQSSSIGLSFN